MQKAYLKFSTVSSITEAQGKLPGNTSIPQKSHWNAFIQAEQKTHTELLNKIQKGERVNGIEKDPLLSADTDMVVEYSNVPGFLRRETSTQGDDKLRISAHDGGVDTVKNVLDKFRKKKEEIQKKK